MHTACFSRAFWTAPNLPRKVTRHYRDWSGEWRVRRGRQVPAAHKGSRLSLPHCHHSDCPTAIVLIPLIETPDFNTGLPTPATHAAAAAPHRPCYYQLVFDRKIMACLN
ncbi:hypothetical protein PoB_001644000 [Plakobranchus ocellatus]|uniref:Uncharacterized protein n=1 Tax=Plakobranchus ocellatus TaxID=259542 RepID=A0AAV3Z5W1_9GAST|nr:hypothetical protein PoB_001644000 [Plakobranchus ocellatus]